MEKQKRWQLYLIIAVLVLTLYNILPTIFYYSQPLKAPIDAKRAEEVALGMVERVNDIEKDSKAWLQSFNHLLGIKPLSIDLDPNNTAFYVVSFKNEQDAALFKRFLPRAGALIPFLPAQLELSPETAASETTRVVVQRNVPLVLDSSEIDQLFSFVPKYDENSQISTAYQEIVNDRVGAIAEAIAGPSRSGQLLVSAVNGNEVTDEQSQELVMSLAKEVVDIDRTLGSSSPIAKRLYAAFTQSAAKNREEVIPQFIVKVQELSKALKGRQDKAKEAKLALEEAGEPVDLANEQELLVLNSQIKVLESAEQILTARLTDFQKGNAPLTREAVAGLIAASEKGDKQTIDLAGYHPLIKGLVVDWEGSRVDLQLYPDVQEIRFQSANTETKTYVKDKLNQFLINDIARVSSLSDEQFRPNEETFVANLGTLSNATSYLKMNLGYLAAKQSDEILNQLLLSWSPTHQDLVRESYPIQSYESFKQASPQDQKLGLVVYAPVLYPSESLPGFRNGSIYVIAKGMDAIVKKYQENPTAPENLALADDFTQLNNVLQQLGFIGYSGSVFNLSKEFSKDYIFELNNYYSALIKATREDLTAKGSKRFAVLDFSDVEQRILTLNKIEDKIQEDLLKWKESYQAVQVDLNETSKYTVPQPTKNVYWENFKLSFAKFFRGDDRKVLKWGLDLSGGKTVRIALVDHNGRPVTAQEDLNQAVNELYNRINKLGVSERTIRVEGSTIMLDFPGSQNLSAADLIKASAMYFHIVNEKFTPSNPALAGSVRQFLQEIWNEAVVTNRKDLESINTIAWEHLGGDEQNPGQLSPRSESAKLLYDSGLRLANPKERSASSAFDDTLSTIGMFRGGDAGEWDNQTQPLIILFHNFALEGSNLENVYASYDSSQGNVLTFGVKGSYEGAPGNPRDTFYNWTSQFAEDKISGSPKEAFSAGRGWRMAVVLNDSIITAPTLNAALREGGTISGRFSQREANQLAADLKAGSLSFTPRILSEQNVSPELGKEERAKGITASLIALALVVILMVGYYKFAGLVASCAVLLNIFIMWGVLQNLGAALTLAGIAGIVLTIGMAVDANVLVFERIREEFKATGRIASAIQAGYRKAFSAIVDSNITTIIAALILIQFDSGPIKGFAVTLIIGILSSMFTALFMTRYFFAGWVKNPENKQLNMAQFLKETHIDFLGKARAAMILSIIAVLVGAGFFFAERKTLFGMDFTGGYSLTLDIAEKQGQPNYRLEAIDAFLAKGASRSDFEVRELSRPNQLRVQFGTSMDEKGHPFYQLAESNGDSVYSYEYQRDPKLNWVVEALQSGGVPVQPSELTSLQKNWTIMSGQFSDSMRNNAIIGLAIALFAILVYITFRFEFKFAVGAVAGLVHDVAITLGVLAILHAIGLPVQIDLQVVGAIMTIIGYALNDTIIVFDRIREDTKLMKRASFSEVINHALNATLSRTVMTSGTTLVVLLALVLLGGQSIFSFSLVMTIGVLVGTLSSLFIASPVMLYFHNREVEDHRAGVVKKA